MQIYLRKGSRMMTLNVELAEDKSKNRQFNLNIVLYNSY